MTYETLRVTTPSGQTLNMLYVNPNQLDTIARFLESRGCPSMAEDVRVMAASIRVVLNN